jgi:hypothetical protein
MTKYRKRPVVVEAYQTSKEEDIDTLEGKMHASAGDYIITGVAGEKYPCKPDIFHRTYVLEEEEEDTDSEGVDFCLALHLLKRGGKMCREGWCEKDVWLALIRPEGYDVKCIPAVDRDIVQLPWIGIKTADNKFVPWIPGQEDLLANDWYIYMTEEEAAKLG